MSRVILVSECGKECPILASILAAVSPTCWGERFGLAPPDGDVRSCENGMSLFEVESFIGVATLLSPYPTMPELMMKPNRSSITAHLDVQRLTAALSFATSMIAVGLSSSLLIWLTFTSRRRFYPRGHRIAESMTMP